MLFSQVASFALFFLSVGSAVASPTRDESAIVARQDSTDVLSILQTLQGKNNNTLAQITNLVNTGNVNENTIPPLIEELTSSISSATASLGAVSPSRRHLKRDVADVTVLLATIITDIATTLKSLLSVKTILALEGLLVSVDVAVNSLLIAVNILVGGVLVALKGLLADVSDILVSLGFTLITLLLGL